MTKLIIAHNHDKTKHQGKGFTINNIRSSGFWIPGMSRTVASFIRQCVTCCRLGSHLPAECIEPPPIHIMPHGLFLSFCHSRRKKTASTIWAAFCLFSLTGRPHRDAGGSVHRRLHKRPAMLHCCSRCSPSNTVRPRH